ncbi:MAG: MFS transporter, partial [Opitutaceae bacterium]
QLLRFPDKPPEEAAGVAESWRMARNPTVLLYFVSIFAYVGCEQGTSNWISEFLRVYHGVNPRVGGAHAVAGFWGLMTVGCLLGLPLLKWFDGRRVLVATSVLALVTLSIALFGSKGWSIVAFPCIGLFASVMWPVVFSLGMNSVATGHGVVAGILCTAIIGGAFVPAIIGRLGDHFGLRGGMLLLYLTFGWILSVGFWARPLVSNTADPKPAC